MRSKNIVQKGIVLVDKNFLFTFVQNLKTMNRYSKLIKCIALVAPFLLSAYTPSPQVIESQKEFESDRFGIFLHWGIYSMFGQGEWYLNYGPDAKEYAKAAGGFYPAAFDADAWVKAIKDSGAKYICFTSRHHDGFSMWHTRQSDYNIVDATPFGRDIIKELSDACEANDISLHLYYSHLDWTRPDYPIGRTGHSTGRDTTLTDWPAYYNFMNGQLKELLTDYGNIRAIWFDGWWDHDADSIPFDWQLDQQYEMIHNLRPGCMVGNNHHQTPFAGEDIQIFERDVPGENTAGLSGQTVSRLPLETCQTMNGMWGYKIQDQNYKSADELIKLLVRTSGKGANLLLNIGPQPDGNLPRTALERLAEMGDWLKQNGRAIYGTTGSKLPEVEWGTSTHRGDTTFVHVLDPAVEQITIPVDAKIKYVKDYNSRDNLKYNIRNNEMTIILPDGVAKDPDYIIEIVNK